MQVSNFGATIVVIEAKPKKSMRVKVDRCISECKCVICGDPAFARALCRSHYYQFEKAKKSLPARERPGFEAKQIREGRVAMQRKGGRPSKKENAFPV